MSGSLRAALAFAVAAGAVPAAPQPLAEATVTVTVAVAESITIESQDASIQFARLTPEQEGWVDALDGSGQLDTAELMIGANTPVTVSYFLGSSLQNGSATLATRFATQTWGRGDLNGTGFETGGTWGNNWTPWAAAAASGTINFAPGRFGLMTKAQVFRQGLNDPPGVYAQAQPFSVIVSPRH